MKVQSSKSYGVDRQKILVHGFSGSGKTSLAKTLDGKTLIVSAEAGLLSIADADIDVADMTVDDKGQVIPKEDRIRRLDEIYQYLLTKEAQEKYDNIFVDSISEISQNLVEHLQKEFPDRKDALVLWGDYAKKMRGIIKLFRDLPSYNVIFTALSVREKDENGQFVIGIDVNGKISQQLPQFLDEVLYLHVMNDESSTRKLITQPTQVVIAKDRSSKLQKEESPHLGNVMEKIRGGK